MRQQWVVTFVIAGFLLCVGYGVGLAAPQEKCLSTKWPHEQSDMVPDPSFVYGRLDNGFRYVIIENSEPKHRVGLYLNIQAGSLHEKESEQGMAHFLEHMLFNGSTHFQPGELVDYFQSIGMDFGGDVNAHTSYDETVYNVILPGASQEELDKGLLVISDYARGALLLEEEIERERGIILAEKRSRDSASYRAHVASSRFTLQGTRFPLRMPIGTIETIKAMDQQSMKKFYDTWYRPENMILVAVGDFRVADIEPLISQRFASLTTSAPVPACVEIGGVAHQGIKTFYHYEKELGSTEVSIESLWNEKTEHDSLALQRDELKRYISSLIMQHRLERLLENPDIPVTQFNYYAGTVFSRLGYGGVTVKTSGTEYAKALQLVETTLRRALQFGFTEPELTRVKKELAAELEAAVLTATTRDSNALARSVIHHLNSDRVLQSPQQEKKIYGPMIEAFTLSEIEASFREVWSHGNRLVSIVGDALIGGDRVTQHIEELYAASTKRAVDAREKEKEVVFPYLHHDKVAGALATTQTFAQIGVERLVFENGVVLNLKKTDFKENSVQLAAHFGTGRQGEPFPGLARLAEAVVSESGTGRLRQSELNGVLAGSTVDVQFRAGSSSFSYSGHAVKQDAQLLFQVVETLLEDPAFRKEAYSLSMKSFEQMYKQLSQDIRGSIQLVVMPFFAGGNDAFGLPPWQEFAQLKLEQVQAWLEPQIKGGALEISVVGDFDRDQIVALAQNSFGRMEERKRVDPPPPEGISFPEGQQLLHRVDSSIDKAVVLVSWPTDDFWDISRTRRLNTLASVFNERLRKVIREKLGASYSPVVYNHSSRIFPGYGLLQAQVIVEPDKVEEIRDAVLAIGTDLYEHGASEKEVAQAKGPTMTSLKDLVRTNGYWLQSVLTLSSRHPQQLTWPTSILPDYASISQAELADFARRYLVPHKAATAIVTPHM